MEKIERAVKGWPLFSIQDAQCTFQLVYVKDVVSAIEKVVEKKAYNTIYNVINDEQVTYSIMNEILKTCQHDVSIEERSLVEAIEQQYPLPYPIFQEEMESYNGQKIVQELGLSYTPLKVGLSKTYQAFYPVFSQNEKR